MILKGVLKPLRQFIVNNASMENSTGPRTPADKARSSRNAFKGGW